MPLTPSQTKAILAELGHRPDKKLGQNFLIDGNLVHKSLAMADLPEEATIVEIGAGLGSLTGGLLEGGHRVEALEIDSTLVSYLKKTFSTAIDEDRLNITDADAVKFPLGMLPEDSADFHVVANLPYAISSPWLESLLATRRLPDRLVLMLQKESVDRYLAKHGTKNYGALSIFLSSSYLSIDTHPVSRRCFHPAPIVDSVLIRMDRRPQPFLFAAETRTLIRRLFTRRRKQLGNLAKAEETDIRDRIQNWLHREKLSPELRPEQVGTEIWQSL